MTIFYHLSELEIAEELAGASGHPYFSEDSVSEAFDKEIMPGVLEQYGKLGVAFTDECAISEAFSAWTDGLQTEGYLAQVQVASYDYVGEWS